MVAVPEKYPKLTPAEYLLWEEQQELRYEYVQGEIRAMSGGTLNHSQIALNFGSLINNFLDGSGCRTFNSDGKVKIEKSDDYLYPDISVTCDDSDRTATKFLMHPCLIVEVLSPSTEAYDRWEKFNLYQQAESLQDYVLVDTNKIEIALYSKDDQNEWKIKRYGPGDIVELKSIKMTFPIEQVYRNINFDN